MTSDRLNTLVQGLNHLGNFRGTLDDSLCIDAFPRSANTFATYLCGIFLMLQERDNFNRSIFDEPFSNESGVHNLISREFIQPRLIHHQHNPTLFRSLLDSGVKCITIARSPAQCIPSVYRYYSEQEQTAQIVAGTYIEWLHIIRLYANKANFIALDFDEVITNPQVISTSLYKLGLVSKAEDEASSKLFAKYTRDLIAEVDKKQHGDLYAERCAVPIENRKSRQDYNFPPEDLMQLEEEYKRVKESIQVLA